MARGFLPLFCAEKWEEAPTNIITTGYFFLFKKTSHRLVLFHTWETDPYYDLATVLYSALSSLYFTYSHGILGKDVLIVAIAGARE